jgi:hypothetical protein
VVGELARHVQRGCERDEELGRGAGGRRGERRDERVYAVAELGLRGAQRLEGRGEVCELGVELGLEFAQLGDGELAEVDCETRELASHGLGLGWGDV